MIIPGFLNLTLAGILLGCAYQKTGNLYFSIGLHAGWIFWLKFYGLVTNSVAGGSALVMGNEQVDRWLAGFVCAGRGVPSGGEIAGRNGGKNPRERWCKNLQRVA